MAVIDKEVAEKASQDKTKDTKNPVNNGQNSDRDSSQDVTSIQDIAERAFNTSYDAVGNVIRTSSKAGVERAIADFQRDIDNFERSFKKDFLQTIEAKSEPYEIGASALRLLSASGVDDQPSEVEKLTARFDELVTLEQSSEISDEQLTELDEVESRLKELGVLKR